MTRSNVRINYYAEQSDFDEIKKALKENKDLRLHIRYMAILNFLQGYNFKEIASMLNISAQTVSTYVRKYRKLGIDGLKIICKSKGAPRYLDGKQESELINIILTKTPDEVGFTGMKNWDSSIIGQLVFQKYGVSFGRTGMIKLLHRNGLSYTRPTYSLEKADKAKQEEFKDNFKLLKKIWLTER